MVRGRDTNSLELGGSGKSDLETSSYFVIIDHVYMDFCPFVKEVHHKEMVSHDSVGVKGRRKVSRGAHQVFIKMTLRNPLELSSGAYELKASLKLSI